MCQYHLNEGNDVDGFMQDRLRRIDELEKGIRAALYELGIPTADYPAPIAHAVGILWDLLQP